MCPPTRAGGGGCSRLRPSAAGQPVVADSSLHPESSGASLDLCRQGSASIAGGGAWSGGRPFPAPLHIAAVRPAVCPPSGGTLRLLACDSIIVRRFARGGQPAVASIWGKSSVLNPQCEPSHISLPQPVPLWVRHAAGIGSLN